MKIDAAERYFLTYPQGFLNRIKAVYPTGAKLILFTDGSVFCDLEKISDDIVIQYENDLKTLAQDLPDIEIRTMCDLCPGKPPSQIRDLIKEETPTLSDFNKAFKSDAKIRNNVYVLSKRMTFELALLFLKKEEIFNIAFEESRRSLQYSQFLKKFRPSCSIVCSVHYQMNLSKKIGLKLSDSHATP